MPRRRYPDTGFSAAIVELRSPRAPKMNSFIERLRGVIGFPVTPWDNDLEFDEPAFRSNVDFLLETGLAALAFCGSNGEIHSVTLDEYERIAKIANEMNQGRKALIFGVGQTLRTAEQQARIARASGADAIMAMAPYMADANEPGLAEYYRRVAGAAGIPVFLYQTKWSGILPLSLLDRLTRVDNIGMVKDENGNLSHYLNVRKTFGDRFYWVNGMAEPFVPSYWNLGVKTFTSGLACFMPDVTMKILQRGAGRRLCRNQPHPQRIGHAALRTTKSPAGLQSLND